MYEAPQAPLDLPTPSVPPSAIRLYSPNQIGLAGFLGSPVAAGSLLAMNWARLGEPDKARQAVLVGIAATAGLVGLAMALPDSLAHGVAIGSVVMVFHIGRQLQGKLFDAHVYAGGGLESSWRAAGTGVLSMVVLIAVLAVGDMAKAAMRDKVVFGAFQTVYEEGTAKPADAQKLGAHLKKIGFFTEAGENGKDVTLTLAADKVDVAFVIQADSADKPEIGAAFQEIGDGISKDVFDGRAVTVRLCNTEMKELRVIVGR